MLVWSSPNKMANSHHFETRAQQYLRWATVATIDMGRKEEGAVPLGGELGPHLTHNVAQPKAYLRTKCHLDPSSLLVTTYTRQKLRLCPFFRRGRGKLGPHLVNCGLG